MIKKKLHVEFPGVLVSGVTQFCGVSKGEALFYLKFPEVKNLKIPVEFSKSTYYVHVLCTQLPCLFFSGITPLATV